MRSIVFGAAAVILLHGCNQSPSSRADSPVAVITSHTSGERVLEGLVELEGTAHAGRAGAADLRTRWLLGTEVVCPDAPPTSVGHTRCTVDLRAPEASITLEVVDPSGQRGSDSVELVVVANTPPEAVISSPSDLGLYVEGVSIAFTGRVEDAEDAPVALSAWWESSRDGPLGVASPPAADGTLEGAWALSVGSHQISLWVQDSRGVRGSAEVELVVVANTPPTLHVLSPQPGEVLNFGEGALFSVEVGDAEQDPSTLLLSWRSDRDGELSTQGADASGYVEFVPQGLSPGLHVLTTTVTDAVGLSVQ